MKKTVFVLAALAAVSGSAFAQSTVTLYGVADTNVSYTKFTNGSKATRLEGLSPWRGPRFGLRGSEDLGGGLKGNFNVEAGYSLANGVTTANNQLFNRQAWVGVSGKFGEVRLGRQDTLTRVSNIGGYSDISAEGELNVNDADVAGSSRPLMYNFGSRLNNVVGYTSPSFSGLRVRAQAALRNTVSGTAASATSAVDGGRASVYGLQATYDAGPLKVAGTYEYFDGQGFNTLGQYNKSFVLGGSYNFGKVTALLSYQNIDKFQNSQFAASTATLGKHDAVNLGVMVPFGQTEVRAQYTMADTRASGTAPKLEANKAGVSVRHWLSKRTAVYGFYIERDGDAIASSATLRKSDVGFGLSHAF